MSIQYQSGLEFLNEGQKAQRAREVKEECETVAPDDFMAYMLMEMYNRGRNEGAAAAFIKAPEIVKSVLDAKMEYEMALTKERLDAKYNRGVKD